MALLVKLLALVSSLRLLFELVAALREVELPLLLLLLFAVEFGEWRDAAVDEE